MTQTSDTAQNVLIYLRVGRYDGASASEDSYYPENYVIMVEASYVDADTLYPHEVQNFLTRTGATFVDPAADYVDVDGSVPDHLMIDEITFDGIAGMFGGIYSDQG